MQAPANFSLTSPAFTDGTPIPQQYRGRLRGHNSSPAVAWTQPPAGTAELVLVVEDADSPFGNPNTHGLAAGITPGLGGIPIDGLTEASTVSGIQLGKAGLKRGWFGPMPIRSHGSHHYVFQLFALDRPLSLPEKFTLRDVVDAMRGHVLGRAKLDGIAEKR